MDRNQVLREILSDSEIIEKYKIKKSELSSLTTNAPYHKKIVEVLSIIINENDNHLNSNMIYKRIKKSFNIG
jgi:hypothetical protein